MIMSLDAGVASIGRARARLGLGLTVAAVVALLALLGSSVASAAPLPPRQPSSGLAGVPAAAVRVVSRALGRDDPRGLDPIAQPTQLTAADGAAFDGLGYSVAASGDTLVVGAVNATVGANSGQGAVYVFTGHGSHWTQEAKLTAADGAQGDQLGSSVAISHGAIIAGAPGATVGANIAQGAAYVFTHDGSHWTQEAKLTAPDGNANDQLGFSVAASGDTVVAGALDAASGDNPGLGAVYVFTGHGSRWSQEAELTSAAGDPDDGQLGFAVAISGDRLIAGAPEANDYQGDAYVFARRGGSWYEAARLTSPDSADSLFGVSVAISGKAAAVGTRYSANGQGAVYAFAHANSGWTEQAKLTAADGVADDGFGASLAMSHTSLVVGAPLATVNGNASQGAAYVFSRGSSGWTQRAKLTAPGELGDSVAVSDGTIVVGASAATVNGNAEQGAAYLYQLRP